MEYDTSEQGNNIDGLVEAKKSSKDYAVLSPCENCRLKCPVKISSEMRQKLNASFSKLDWWERHQSYVTSHVKMQQIKRRKPENSTKRVNHYFYFMMSDNDSEVQVCKLFFLSTLGYKFSNDSVISNTMNGIDPLTYHPKPDGRGKKKTNSTNVELQEVIKNHIESYNLSVSHYRIIAKC